MSESQEQPAPAKSEISPLATSEVGKPNKDKSLQKPKKGISKKQLAARLMASAAIATTIGLKGDTVARGLGEESVVTPTEVVRELSIQDLEERAEQLYQIQIASLQEGIVVLADGTNVKPNEWTKDEISDLMKTLDSLPSSFYLPGPKDVVVHLPSLSGGRGYAIDPSKDRAQEEKQWQARQQQIKQQNDKDDIAEIKKYLGKDFNISNKDLDEARKKGHFEKQIKRALPVRFTMTDVVPMDLGDGQVKGYRVGQCHCGISNTNPEVLLRKGTVGRDFHDTFSTIVHELVHRVSTPDDYKFVSELLEVPENMNFGDFVYNNAFLSYSKNFSSLKDAGFKAWAEGNKYYYGTRSASEYISVASESYIDGKEKFLKIYSIFIGEEKAGRFYDHMRDNIFRGTEYKNYQKVTK